jgi:hypothetical protein
VIGSAKLPRCCSNDRTWWFFAELVQTEAMLDALATGKFAGAGLGHDRSGAVAGRSCARGAAQRRDHLTHRDGQSQVSSERGQRVFVDHAERFTRGLPLLNVVDKRKGY